MCLNPSILDEHHAQLVEFVRSYIALKGQILLSVTDLHAPRLEVDGVYFRAFDSTTHYHTGEEIFQYPLEEMSWTDLGCALEYIDERLQLLEQQHGG